MSLKSDLIADLRDRKEIAQRAVKLIERRFPVGARVMLTTAAAAMFPRYAKARGTIVRYRRDGQPVVLWDRRKTNDIWNHTLLRKVRK